MTPPPITPLTDRKDFDHLISHQNGSSCLPQATGAESVVAFLMRLYAYFVSKFYNEMMACDITGVPSHEGTAAMKTRLLSSGPYCVGIRLTDYHLRPDALVVKSVPQNITRRGWLILWPGAARDIYVRTGRNAPALVRNFKSIVATMFGKTRTIVIILTDNPAFKRNILQHGTRPIRLIPP